MFIANYLVWLDRALNFSRSNKALNFRNNFRLLVVFVEKDCKFQISGVHAVGLYGYEVLVNARQALGIAPGLQMDQQFGNNGILRVVVDVVLDEHLTTVYVSLLFNCLVLERALKMNVRNAADNCTFDFPLVEADVNGLVAEKHQAGRRRLRSAEGQQLEDSGSKQIDLLAA